MNLQGDKLFLDISEADIPVSGPLQSNGRDHCRCLFNQAVNSLDESQHLCDHLFSMWCLASQTSDAGQETTHHNELLHAPPTFASQQLVVRLCTREPPQHQRQVSMLTTATTGTHCTVHGRQLMYLRGHQGWWHEPVWIRWMG